MTAIPASGDITNAATQSALQTDLEAHGSVLAELPGGAAEVATTITTNTFQPADRDGVMRRIDTSTAAQALYSIDPTHCRDGHILYLAVNSSSNALTISNEHGGTGQIKTADSKSLVLTDPRQWVALKYNLSTTSWDELSRSSNIDAAPIAGVGSYELYSAPNDGTTGKPSWLALVRGHLQHLLDFIPGWLARGTALTVTANAITPIQRDCVVDTSGAAQTINTIDQSNTTDGNEIRISLSGSNSLTLANNAGGAANPVFTADGSNLTLTDSSQYVTLQRVGTQWKEVARVGFDFEIVVNGRLSVQSGTPFSDGATGTTLYFTPYKGSWLSTHNGTRWNKRPFTELSVSLSSLRRGQLANVFVVDPIVSGAFQLELEAYATKTITNNLSAGSNVVIDTADTSGISVGDLVGISDTSGQSEIALVKSVSANVSITVDALSGNYLLANTPLIMTNTPASGTLAKQDGVPVKSGDTKRLFVGTIMVRPDASGSASVSDVAAGSSVTTGFMFGVWNFYNRTRRIGKLTAGSNQAISASTWTLINNFSCSASIVFAPVGFVEDSINARYNQLTYIASAGNVMPGLATQVGRAVPTSANAFTTGPGSSATLSRQSTIIEHSWLPRVGYNSLAAVTNATVSGTVTGGDATYGSSSFIVDHAC